MTKLKVKKLQQSILNEIASVVNNSMSTDDKVNIVRASIDRYDTQIKSLRLEEAIKDLASKDSEITEAKDNGSRTT